MALHVCPTIAMASVDPVRWAPHPLSLAALVDGAARVKPAARRDLRRIGGLTGEDLLPTYGYLRIYRQGDICRVHGDRLACEHSVSLTLAYSDDQPWALEVSPVRTDKPYQRADDQFRPDEPTEAALMQPGDGVLYQGVHHHHARTTPNPNAWSAHLFLHWVSREGPYADQAFDGQVPPGRVELD